MKNSRLKQRQGDREERRTRDVSDSVTVSEPDEYLDHVGLCKRGKRIFKVRTADISMRNVEKTSQKTTLYLKSSHLPPHQWMIRVKSDSDNDLILYESDSESDNGSSDGQANEKFTIELTTAETSRSGRKTGHWATTSTRNPDSRYNSKSWLVT